MAEPDAVKSTDGKNRDRKLIFISYASADRGPAERLVNEIEARGMPCWMAPRDVPGGANWGKTILDAIEAAEIFVVLLSAGANKSIHVANEIERAASYRKTIVPLRIENVMPSREIELHISARHWVDLFEGPQQREQNMRRFLDVLRDVLRAWLVPDLPPLDQELPQPGDPISARTPDSKAKTVEPTKTSSRSTEEMLAALYALLTEADFQNRNRVVFRAQQLIPEHLKAVAINKLHTVLEEDSYPDRRETAAALLVKLGSTDLVRFRATLLKEPVANVRTKLVEVSRNLPRQESEDYLFEIALSDDSDYVRDAAFRTLIEKNRDRGFDAVREFLSEGSRRPQFAYNSQKMIAPIATEAELPVVFELATMGLGDNYSNGLPSWSSLKRFSRKALLQALQNSRVNPEHRAKLSAEIDGQFS